MTHTPGVPLEIIAVVQEMDGGGYWHEVPRFPSCVAATLREEPRVSGSILVQFSPSQVGVVESDIRRLR